MPDTLHGRVDIIPSVTTAGSGEEAIDVDPAPTIVLHPETVSSSVFIAVRSGIAGTRRRDSIFLNGTAHSIIIKRDFNKESIILDGNAGKMFLHDGEGHESLVLDGSTGDILLSNEDCAEDFDIMEDEQIEPGSVMVIQSEGKLKQSHLPYDKRVAGVISGAGNYRPGIVLGKRHSNGSRKPVALLGKVFCRVDAQYSSIQMGDLLTTSATPGHAMKAQDPVRAFGSVLGKALRPLKTGKSLIPILIALQ